MLQDSAPSSNWDITKGFGYKIDAEVSNYLSFSTVESERYNIDGETLTIKQSAYTNLSDTLRVGIAIPFLRHSSGIFDNAIYSFHDLFGMPQNGRTKDNADKLLWNASYDNQSAIIIREDKQGIGDIELFTEKNLDLAQSLTWRMTLKLPTGSTSKQTGNGAYGLSAGISSMQPHWLSQRSWLKESPISLWYSSAITYNQQVEKMSDFSQNSITLAALIGASYAFNPHWELKTQLNTHTPYFDSNIRELGWAPLIFSVEGLYSSTNNIQVGLRFSEDLRPRVTPDFSLGLVVAYDY
jgi:hypothetical protein